MLRMLHHLLLVSVIALTAFGLQACAAIVMAKKTPDGKWAFVPLADGFDFPVGKPDGKGYYKSRGLRLATPRHLGEDWNGNGGGNSDLGDPVYSIGMGLVTYAADARGRWGKVVIVRHALWLSKCHSAPVRRTLRRSARTPVRKSTATKAIAMMSRGPTGAKNETAPAIIPDKDFTS